ncbi:hypothetical protein [Mucilaginibacter lacusdianchii]|uniref:hypothetical protein n=1 Tax=Mucilaginibacter lacusdianchii TaxID=2684211 RepID=UPI00131CEE77|nr:hypothetical protein [Mucilaginibacter sp. JXJ CY 39]
MMKVAQTFKIAFFSLWVSLFLIKLAVAQSYSRIIDPIVPNRAQNIFVELGGPGLLLSLNYDTRFLNRHDGVGGRVGVGYLSIDKNSLLTVPLQINYLLGKNGKYFELGLGATFVKLRGNEDSFLSFDDASSVLGNMTFGYRYQPEDGGFHYRAGLTPLFNKSNFIPYFGSVGFGYTF